MKRIFISLAVLTALLAPILLKTQTSYAVDINNGNGNTTSICDGVTNSAYCSDTGNPTNRIYGKNGVIVVASYIISIIAGVAAVIMIVIGGVRFMVSGGDPSSVASARSSIIFAVVGLIVIVASEALFLFVINKF
ncbi:MAG: hypothetical protein ABSB12_03225 [Candidatus Saccharimonadales bacterium]|jgi:branched-subunit amino acid transport protein